MAEIKGIRGKDAEGRNVNRQIDDLLEVVNLTGVAYKKIGGFSGGMKQRVLIAQALLGEPKLIILDEPTAGLDPKQRVIIRRLVSSLAKEKIIIISTHIVSDIESIADEIIFIKDGKIIDSGKVSELVSKVNSGEKNLENLYMEYYGDDE
jgi:ABC-type multidrug transport system ATPase subunit